MSTFDGVFIAAFVALIVFFMTLWLSNLEDRKKSLVIAASATIIVMGLLGFVAKKYGFASTILGIPPSESTKTQQSDTEEEKAVTEEASDAYTFASDNGNTSVKDIQSQTGSSSEQAIEKVEKEQTIYLLDAVEPYDKPYWYDASSIINMGGKAYSHGFSCMGYEDSPDGNVTYFNLDGQYTDLTFTAGIIKNNRTGDNVSFTIYTDGEVADHFEMKKSELPSAPRSVNVTGCKQLKIAVSDGYGVADGSGTYGIVEIMVTHSANDDKSEKKDIGLESNQIYLLDAVEPYDKPYWYDASSIINMGGKAYSHGFSCMGYEDSPDGNVTYFNLDGQYTDLTFTAGIIKNNRTGDNVSFTIYTDGEVADHFEMKKSELPSAPRSVNVTGCKQLKIAVSDGYGVADGSGTYGIVEIMVTKK